MSGTRGHRELVGWQKAMGLVEEVYRASASFPASEQYGLTSQMRRAAVSVPSNISEGHGRGGGDYLRFVGIAYGSLMELETQIELSTRLGFLKSRTGENLIEQTNEVARILNGLRRKLREPPASSRLPPGA